MPAEASTSGENVPPRAHTFENSLQVVRRKKTGSVRVTSSQARGEYSGHTRVATLIARQSGGAVYEVVGGARHPCHVIQTASRRESGPSENTQRSKFR